MYDYGFFSYESKSEFLDRSREFWNPDKTDFWQDAGVDLVIDRREGYFFWDMAGRRLIDLHLNGGTYNVGHRNPELIATLEQAMQRFDIGNHHFPALARTALAEALVATCPPNMRRVIYGASGGEAIDIAIKTARHTRKRRKVVSILKGYHGHTGLAVGTTIACVSCENVTWAPEYVPRWWYRLRNFIFSLILAFIIGVLSSLTATWIGKAANSASSNPTAVQPRGK